MPASRRRTALAALFAPALTPSDAITLADTAASMKRTWTSSLWCSAPGSLTRRAACEEPRSQLAARSACATAVQRMWHAGRSRPACPLSLPLRRKSRDGCASGLHPVRADRCGSQADFTTLWAPVCARRKIPPGEFTAALAAKVQVRARCMQERRCTSQQPLTHGRCVHDAHRRISMRVRRPRGCCALLLALART